MWFVRDDASSVLLINRSTLPSEIAVEIPHRSFSSSLLLSKSIDGHKDLLVNVTFPTPQGKGSNHYWLSECHLLLTVLVGGYSGDQRGHGNLVRSGTWSTGIEVNILLWNSGTESLT